MGRPAIYPWSTMKVGETFEVRGVSPDSARSMAYNAARRTGRKFTTTLHKTKQRSFIVVTRIRA